MRVVLLVAAAFSMLGISVYGWRVIPEEGRFTFRWGIFGFTGTLSKRGGLGLWLVHECFILGGLVLVDDPAALWIGVSLLMYLFLFHWLSIRRLR